MRKNNITKKGIQNIKKATLKSIGFISINIEHQQISLKGILHFYLNVPYYTLK